MNNGGRSGLIQVVIALQVRDELQLVDEGFKFGATSDEGWNAGNEGQGSLKLTRRVAQGCAQPLCRVLCECKLARDQNVGRTEIFIEQSLRAAVDKGLCTRAGW